MATKKRGAAQKNSQRQRTESMLASRARIERRMGPPVVEAPAPKAGLVYLLQRVDMLDLVKHGHWPKPLVAQVNQLIVDGSEGALTAANAEKYCDMCYRVVMACAVVPPDEVEELGGPPPRPDSPPRRPPVGATEAQMRAFERDRKAWEKELAAYEEQREEWGEEMQRTLRAIDPKSLRPLFVEPGEEQGDDQLVLLPPGSPEAPDAAAGEVKLAYQDLMSLTSLVFEYQTGPLLIFR